MTLRAKLVVALVALSTVVSLAVGAAAYASARHELIESVDDSLRSVIPRLADDRVVAPGGAGTDDVPSERTDRIGRDALDRIERRRGLEGVLTQLVGRRGDALGGSTELPISASDIDIANGRSASALRTISLNGENYRMYTTAINGGALQLARSTASNDAALSAMARRIIVLVALAALAAGLIGWWIGHHLTRRLTRLSAAAEQVAQSGRLDVPVDISGTDETARVATAMRDMLVALASSRDQQRRLVQDAGHELRTPLTSLRTNVSVLQRFDELPADARRQLLDDLGSETRELTSLVNELVELATDQRSDEPAAVVDLGELAERAAQRSRRRSGRDVVVRHDGVTIVGRRHALDRCVSNLLDNAAKFAPDGPIELTVARAAATSASRAAAEISVRDHGPGIVEAEANQLFDRFHRSDAARALPGSGLGLSIVAAVAQAHGGTVFARNAPGGGAVFGFTVAALDSANASS
jgi:two-component system, OmpR family, sensor histidine kinase MprB